MKRLVLLVGTLGFACVSHASAQGFNIDVCSFYGTPASTFGAGAGQPGFWNSVPGVSPMSAPLLDLNGNPTGATISAVGSGYEFNYNNTGTSGDDEALMDDTSDPTPSATWTISGVAAGNYVLYTYAWAPDSATYYSFVSVPGSSDPGQNVGGLWTGFYTQGLTHAVHHITVGPGGSLGMNISVAVTFATLNGFQLVEDHSGVSLCEPGSAGVIACPCANPPSGSGLGCDNSSFTGGAGIAASGNPNLALDTLQFTTAGEKPTATSILLQGNASIPAGVVFGQGVRCVGGTLKRLYTVAASGGSIHVPPPGGPSVSARSAALGDTIVTGTNRYYMVYYRDPVVLGGCPGVSTYNSTNTLEIPWQ